jgi:hypothetical protein
VADRLDLAIAGVGIGILERDAEADVTVERAPIAEIEPGELAEGDRADRKQVRWPRVELAESVAGCRGRGLDLRRQQQREEARA